MIRAALIECVMEVGLDHHRYYVMDIMDTLLLETKPAVDAVVAERLERNVGAQQLRAAAARINVGKLPTAMRRLFEGAAVANR